MSLTLGIFESPLGPVHFTLHNGAIASLGFAHQADSLAARVTRRIGVSPTHDPAAARWICERLDRYFRGDLSAFDGIDVDLGGTPFQARVWAELRTIPAGALRSYGEIAKAIGAPDASRAVGAANGQNPVSLVVPCHRVVGSAGALTGYAGGVERKKWLIEHERRGALDLAPALL